MNVRGLALAGVVALALASPAHAEPVAPVDRSCFAPAGDPAPGTAEWVERDARNQYCASLRNRDQLLSPAFGVGNLTQGAALWAEQLADQLADPMHPRGGITTLIPGARSADPFRTIRRWTATGRGRVAPVRFKALDGATLRGYVFAPPARVRKPKRGFPGVVITDGSVQGYQQLYFWAAQDLASAGYVVLTYDVQGQGESDLLPESCTPDACPGVPFQQDYNFHQGAEDSLDFFLSDANPYADLLDERRVGLAGHSLGASAISVVGQCDKRVRAIVAWDNLRKIDGCDSVTIPPQHRSADAFHAPALGISNDYGFWTQPAFEPPDPDAKAAGFEQVAKAGLDAQLVVIRGGTHLEYSYIPLVFQASELGERIASYYTRAWFDRHLKGSRKAFDRLTATTFDRSADVHSIGAGVFDPAAFEPGDLLSGNVPHEIAGVGVRDAVSFYYRSAYALDAPDGTRRVCRNIRNGCG